MLLKRRGKVMDNLQKFENEINNSLSGNKLKIATDFVTYMKSNGMTAYAEHVGAFEYNSQSMTFN